MARKPQHPSTPRRRRPSGKNAPDTDTTSLEQLQGSPGPHGAPGKLPYPREPHERDESARPSDDRLKQRQRPPSDRQITQAADDIETGKVDTDRRGIPNDVPGSERT